MRLILALTLLLAAAPLRAVDLAEPAGGRESFAPLVAQIQDFRRLAGLPEMQPATMQALAASPETMAAARVEAAQALLARTNPEFSTRVDSSSGFLESPRLLEWRRAVGAARLIVAQAGVGGLRESLSDKDGISEQKLVHAYDAPPALVSQAKDLAGLNGDAVREMIADGAPRHAGELLERWAKKTPSMRQGPPVRLSLSLKTAGESKAVTDFAAGLAVARRLLGEGKYGPALGVALELQGSTRKQGFRPHTERALWLDAADVVDAVKRRGMSVLYGLRGPLSAQDLAARVDALDAKDYVGDLLPRKPTRIQCYGDCAIQQSYNHPKLSALAEQMPYATFLRAMEGRLNNPEARHEGLMSMETSFALKELGLKVAAQKPAKTPEELSALLRERGALLASIRFTEAKEFKEGLHGNHAVIVQGAFREDGEWNFVMIDSNHARPQVMTFDELRIFGIGELRSVEAMPESDPTFNKALRGIADPSERMRRAIHLFYGKYAAVREVVPWYKNLFYGSVNLVREKMLDLEPLEPAGREIVDANLVPVWRLPAKWKEALGRGLKLPKEAVVTDPKGRKYLNRLVVERVLDAASSARYPGGR